jgi:hypothetical protein
VCEEVSAGVGRCANPAGCAPPGEICEEGTNECCPGNPDGDQYCQLNNVGILRCLPEDWDECLPDDAICTHAAECCSGICVPDGNGVYHCSPGCVADGEPCTTDADCCSGSCNEDGICGPSDNPCVPLGGQCAVDEDCCSNECIDGYCTITVE